MKQNKKRHFFIPFMVLGMLASAFFFSRYVDRQVDKYALEVHMKKWREENLKCGTVTYGPYISFRETLPPTSEIKP